MNLFRNKELRRLTILILAIDSVAFLMLVFISIRAAGIFLFSSVLVFGLLFLNLRYRYRRLSELAAYLKRVNGGDFRLQLPQQEEGELSILQSEIYKVTVSLKEQNEHLKSDKNRLEDLLSDISHQFKTPLTSISLMTDLLIETDLDPEQKELFSMQVQAQLKRLTWLTNALLKLSRLDANSVQFQPKRVKLSELIDNAAGSLEVLMDLKQQEMVVETEGEIFCDLYWTAEALTNVIKNCIEHSPEGGKISLRASENALFSEIVIEDNGSGIPPEDLPYLFERFYRGRYVTKDSVGIGLAMSKAIINAQSGTLTAANAKNSGAVFYLRLPNRHDTAGGKSAGGK